jgi:phosphoribosylaminoimidazolecarboxamide formyltransferase/IMP cyclohydrolase
MSFSSRDQLSAVTTIKPTEDQIRDMLFAEKLVKHTKSNAIILVKDQQLIASGTGQTSRVDALNQAILKAKTFKLNIKGAAMASDAFFPFPDCVEIASEAGVATIVQPGGSIKDQLSIDMANSKSIVMVTTGVRHFRH